MNSYGFLLKKLNIVGDGVEAAEVVFKPGLNVISGPSNTGKSYIFQCIDFMMGAEKIPKEIDENKLYTTVLLEIEDANGISWVLKRSLLGGDFHLIQNSIDSIQETDEVKGLLHQFSAKNPDNISSFLFRISGIKEAKILKNVRTRETGNLTCRIISQLFLVSENDIIKESSPIYMDSGYANTTSKWAFNYLLTGIDSSSVIKLLDLKISKAEHAARLEVFNSLINDLEEDIAALKGEEEKIPKRIDEIESFMAELSNKINLNSQAVIDHQLARKKAWEDNHEANSRIIVIDELLKRFKLLNDHYSSDLARLEFINEGQHYYEQLEDVSCPYCGTSFQGHNSEFFCEKEGKKSIDIQNALQSEVKKIHIHMKDLTKTMSALLEERREKAKISEKNRAIIDETDLIIKRTLEPTVAAQKNKLAELINAHKALNKLEAKKERLRELWQARSDLIQKGHDTNQDDNSKLTIDRDALRKLCDIIKQVLDAWKYPDSGIVEFDEPTMDFVIGGKRRQSNGKGIRSITHAAFNIAFLNYCIQNDRPHPGIIVLDSPLTTFREGQQESFEEVSGEIQSSFFNSLASAQYGQIIILENKEPPLEVKNQINYIEFSGKNNPGRQGFFPPLPAAL